MFRFDCLNYILNYSGFGINEGQRRDFSGQGSLKAGERQEKRLGEGGRQGKKEGVGNGILSHPVTRAVPSALVSLTAGFGMGPGVPSRL